MLCLELKESVPTLWLFLQYLLLDAKENFICYMYVISMVLKMQCKQLCQVQKAVSMMLHGNGVHKQVFFCRVTLTFVKQVFQCLQPFMITVSVTAAANTVKVISDRHDADAIS